MRYDNKIKEKNNGVVYTPTEMADYLADQMIIYSILDLSLQNSVTILDPAVGEGELLLSLIKKIKQHNSNVKIIARGYETDESVALTTQEHIETIFPDVEIQVFANDFLKIADQISDKYDFIIANPPYIRTQILGADKAQEISKKMELTGRVDICYAFILYMKQLLSDNGISGFITSNKFFTIKAGASVRDFMINNYNIHSIVDFGDTKLFTASVLPCIIIFSKGSTTNGKNVKFSSIYESKDADTDFIMCNSIFEHINDLGRYRVTDGRIFDFEQGFLQSIKKGDLWLITSDKKEQWLRNVEANTWIHFSDIGKIRVGIKTTADNVFIGDKWTGNKSDLEWLHPLITHRDAGQIVSRQNTGWKVLYTHTSQNGKKQALDIELYPKTKAYLQSHFEQLSSRKYVLKANRNWYEIWVPQNPSSWSKRKIVFRDISEQPEFWLDETGAIVNGDCYWIDIDDSVFEETIYLALAISNSKFIEKYYDAKFNTKLYSRKRRYMTQYVEQFPIPYPTSEYAQKAIAIVKKIIVEHDNIDISYYMNELNRIVDSLFES